MPENDNNIENSVTAPQIPPNDLQAEQAVLSCMMFENADEALSLACNKLVAEDFYRPQHQEIFKAIFDLYAHNEKVDLITINHQLELMGVIEKIGGIEYLTTVYSYASTTAGIEKYIKIIKEKSTLRKLIKAGNDMVKMGFKSDGLSTNIIAETEKVFESLSEGKGVDGFTHIKNVLENTIEEIEENYKMGNKIIGVETGFNDLDFKLSGLQKADLILIAARPAMGKTAFALNIALHAAVKKNITTAIFSMEMSAEQLASRLICSHAYIDSQKLRSMQMDEEDWINLARTAGEISEAPLYIFDRTDVTVLELRAQCRKLKKEKNLGLIVIDYLQLMSSGGRVESRQQEISAISRALKNLALELKIPIIALSQLSRAVEQRPNKRPMLSDLRESGAIEQDADVVCFLYRDEYYNKEKSEKPGQAEVIIAKNRRGEVCSVDLAWVGKYTKFENIERQYTNL